MLAENLLLPLWFTTIQQILIEILSCDNNYDKGYKGQKMSPVFRELKVTLRRIGDCLQEDGLNTKPIQPRSCFTWMTLFKMQAWLEVEEERGREWA